MDRIDTIEMITSGVIIRDMIVVIVTTMTTDITVLIRVTEIGTMIRDQIIPEIPGIIGILEISETVETTIITETTETTTITEMVEIVTETKISEMMGVGVGIRERMIVDGMIDGVLTMVTQTELITAPM